MYALGVVGYQCLTGKALFSGDTREVLQAAQAATPPALPSDVPPGLAELIRGLLARDPADRPGDADAIAAQAQRMVRAHSAGVALDEAASSADAYPAEPTQAVAAPRTLGPMTSVLAKSPRRSPRTVLSAQRPRSTALAVGVLVALLVAATLLASRILTTGPSRHVSGGSTTPGTSTGQPVTVTGATLFGSGDHPEELQNVKDSSSSTAWFTEHYASADFGGLKAGVGLRLQISSTAAVRTVVIRFADPGIAASLYAGTDAVPQGQSKPVATTSSAPTEWRVVLPSPVDAQTWMIWITRLVPDSGGYRAGVANVDFYV
jgi:hypothetical protein